MSVLILKLKKRPQHRSFPGKFANILRTCLFTEQLRWLLLWLPCYRIVPQQLMFFFFQLRFKSRLLVYMFSLRFSGSKFFINLRRQFGVRKYFRTQIFAGFVVFSILCWYFELLFHETLPIDRSLTSVFVPVNRIVFNRSNVFIK